MEGLREKISEIVEKKTHEIFAEVQDFCIANGREVTGDIEPLEAFRLGELQKELEEIVNKQVNQ